MGNENVSEINNSKISIEQAWEMFSILFEDPKNIDATRSLFEWIPWLARQQKVEETIQIAKWWLQNLKNTIV